MNPARERILEALRAANRGHAGLPADAPVAPRPALPASTLETFIARVHAASASLEAVTGWDHLAVGVNGYLEREGLGGVTVAADPRLEGLSLTGARRRAVQSGDAAGLTLALAGVAETGSVVLASGPSSATTLNLLPDHLLVVVESGSVVAHLEDLWSLLRARYDPFPRAVNLITGPSRTADVEQIIQLGAHGARRLHLLLLESENAR